MDNHPCFKKIRNAIVTSAGTFLHLPSPLVRIVCRNWRAQRDGLRMAMRGLRLAHRSGRLLPRVLRRATKDNPTPKSSGVGLVDAFARLPEGYSSIFFSLLMTANSSSVVMSPWTSPLVASSRSRRRLSSPVSGGQLYAGLTNAVRRENKDHGAVAYRRVGWSKPLTDTLRPAAGRRSARSRRKDRKPAELLRIAPGFEAARSPLICVSNTAAKPKASL